MNDRKIDSLIKRIAAGDRGALGELYIGTKSGVYAFLFPYCGAREITEDCLQTVYLKIGENAGAYRSCGNARAWILQIAKNTALDEQRKARKIAFGEPPPEVGSDPSGSFVFDVMRAALADDEREIVIQHVLWGYKHREIAEIRGLPVGTVTSKYKRAVAKLKSALKEEEDE